MSPQKRISPVTLARQMRGYKPGEKVRILRGRLAGQVFIIHQSANDWVMLKEMPRRDVMSKGNIEPEQGFTDEEMIQAKRAAERIQGKED